MISLFDPLLDVVAPATVGRKTFSEKPLCRTVWLRHTDAGIIERTVETLGRRYERFRADSTTLYSSFFVHTHLLQRVVCFSDVSVIAIAAVAYLKTVSTVGEIHVAFVITIKLALHPARAVPHAPWALHNCLGNWNGRFYPRRNEYWHSFNITTERNPADHGAPAAVTLKSINWFTGLSFLLKHPQVHISQTCVFELLHPNMDAEVHPWNSNL